MNEVDLRFLDARLEEDKNNASMLYNEMEVYLSPFSEQAARYDALSGHAGLLENKLSDLTNRSTASIGMAKEASDILNRIA
jgi:hypothetical protein